MPHYETERHVAHSAGDMFSLVGDVERYPEFVPFCERLVVRARRQDGSAEVIVVDYEFRSRMLALLMGSLFDKMFRRFVEAFEAQADAVYGKAATLRG
jgi:ribosome-associated toxin RatA of RatAB toxin-antitoxin module